MREDPLLSIHPADGYNRDFHSRAIRKRGAKITVIQLTRFVKDCWGLLI